MPRRKFLKLTALLLVGFLSVLVAHAQEKSTLQITLTDRESALIRQAAIKLKDKNGATVRELGGESERSFGFDSIAAGEYVLEIQAEGFAPLTQNIVVKPGANFLNIKLEIAEIKARVEVTREEIEKRFEEAFSRTLTIDEIEALPNDPNEIETELKRKYGDDILIRVNGFTGGRLPPKEMIQSIKVIRSVFDAEFHRAGQTVVDIKTKAGLPKMFGFFAFNFNDWRMNARNAFAARRLPEQNKFLVAFLGIPVAKNKTSALFSVFANDSYEKNVIVAIPPNRRAEPEAKSGNRLFVGLFGIDHNLSKNHTAHLNYSLEKFNLTNAGVGEFNLPETGFSSRTRNHRIRLSESGTIAKLYANEFRVEVLDAETVAAPNTRAVGITVSGAFAAGGASVDNRRRQQRLNAVDNLLFDRGGHSLKIGGEVELERLSTFSADNTNGKFFFASLADFQNNRPAVFTIRQAASRSIVRQAQIAAYVQDDVRLARNFQIGLGLRYERQNNLRDFNNFSPRLSFIYSPTKEGKIVFRTGTGVFYEWLEAETVATILNNDGRQASDLIVRNPAYSNAFASSGASVNVPPLLAPSVFRKDGDLENPAVFVVQTGFNWRAAKKLNVETFYTFRRGAHQFRSRDANAPVFGVRPDRAFGRVTQVESSGTFTENAMEIRVDGSLPRQVSFNARYRLAKSINDFDGIFALPADNYDLRREKGFSALDQRHSFTANFSFTLLKKLQATAIFRLVSPLPYTITTGFDDNGDTVFNDRSAGVERNSERGDWLNQTDLRLGWRVPIAKRGGAKREESKSDAKINKSSAAATDFLKNYSIGVEVTVQNIFNQTNLQNFVGNRLSPFYRQATSAAPARRIQIGLNFFF